MKFTSFVAALSAGFISIIPTVGSPAAVENATGSATSLPQDAKLVAAQEFEMFVTDFDEEQAARAGNRIETVGDFRVLIDGATGDEISRVPLPGSAPTTQFASLGIVYGPCGSSDFYMFEGVGRSYFFVTGFDLNRQAISYAWAASVIGEYAGGIDSFEWDTGGVLLSESSWTSGAVFDDQDSPSGTYHFGRVTNGQAFIANGEVCSSGFPSDGLVLKTI